MNRLQEAGGALNGRLEEFVLRALTTIEKPAVSLFIVQRLEDRRLAYTATVKGLAVCTTASNARPFSTLSNAPGRVISSTTAKSSLRASYASWKYSLMYSVLLEERTVPITVYPRARSSLAMWKAMKPLIPVRRTTRLPV